MSGMICDNCGRQTNTALCDWVNREPHDGRADRCFLAYVDGEWVKGCAYDDANGFEKHYPDTILSETQNA